jgi:acetolactate synthase small subunit
MLQVADKPSRIKNFIDLLEPFGVIETSYTGSAALSLGPDKL